MPQITMLPVAERLRCSAPRTTPYCNDAMPGPWQCKGAGAYLVNGSTMCTAHAKAEALRILMTQ